MARGNIAFVEDDLEELAEAFGLKLDKNSLSYRQLGFAVLKAYVRALEDIQKRNAGEVVDTPDVAEPLLQTPVAVHSQPAAFRKRSGVTFEEVFESWQKGGTKSEATIKEFAYSIRLFGEFFGTKVIVDVSRSDVRQFREALQEKPARVSGQLRNATLPDLVKWAARNKGAKRISVGTVNKILTALQALATWAYDNGLIPEDTPWTNPFSRMLLEDKPSDREPWTPEDLRGLFASPVFSAGERPRGGGGDAAYWLPLLGLYTGARLGELAPLTVRDIVTEDETGITAIKFSEIEEEGRRLKTISSRRVVPIHPKLVDLGFLAFILARQREAGADARLFPALTRGPKGSYGDHWSKWFGRYIRSIGITNPTSVFHSFQHGFKDALRAVGVSEEVHDALTGHAGTGGVGRRYGAKDMVRRFGLKRLAEAVALVDYPSVEVLVKK